MSAGRPAALQADPAHARAHDALARGERTLLVVGGAGTGKTTFLNALRRTEGDKVVRQVFLAPTGVAALQLGGQTIHSFFGIPPRLFNPDEVKPRPHVRRLLKKLDRVVIDEISMVRSDLVDAIDISLRTARNSREPFGGVQMVLVGDFLQLPPVVPRAEEEMLGRMGYAGPFAFHAKALADLPVSVAPFATVHRQSERDFIAMLDAIRRGVGAREAAEALNAACVRDHRPGAQPVLLTPTNARAEAYNAAGLDALPGSAREYAGDLKGDFGLDGDRLPVNDRLLLKPGARVMALRNDPARRWVNGSVGTVLSLDAKSATVRLDTGGLADIEAHTWERIRYGWDDASERIEADVVGTYTQLPLAPAWALTMHKAQGLTLDDVRIDLGNGAFAPGQAYVALSRARSLAGLSLVRPIRGSDVRVDREVAAFMAACEGAG